MELFFYYDYFYHIKECIYISNLLDAMWLIVFRRTSSNCRWSPTYTLTYLHNMCMCECVCVLVALFRIHINIGRVATSSIGSGLTHHSYIIHNTQAGIMSGNRALLCATVSSSSSPECGLTQRYSQKNALSIYVCTYIYCI